MSNAKVEVVLNDRAIRDELVRVELGHRVLECVFGVVDDDRLVVDVVRIVQELEILANEEILKLDADADL